MAYNPGVAFFIPFHDVDPSTQNQCIFFTQKGARCKWYCNDKDNRRAIFLRDSFLKAPTGLIDIEIITEYVQCNCCARAKHRDRIEDVELLIPLAQRWFEEIRLKRSKLLYNEADLSCVQQGKQYNHAFKTSGTSSTQVKVANISISDNSSCARLFIPASSRTFEGLPISGTLHNLSKVPLTSPKVLAAPFHSFQTSPRYELRNRHMSGSEDTPQISPSCPPPKSRSEFRPHISDPSPDDCVYRKMLDPLEDRDFESGRLYIFDRVSSPGHVKIGWTAKSVTDRLRSWSNCGYEPNLLFSTDLIPNAMRAETLTHYELIKEWRRERMCKAAWCGKSHQEWFEMSGERAKQVVSDWANFMEIARPYDKGGFLKPEWREVIKKLHHKLGLVTAERLLGLCKATLNNQGTALEKSVDLSYTSKIKEEMHLLRPVPMLLRSFKEEKVCDDRSSMQRPGLSKNTTLVKIGRLSRHSTEDQLVKSRTSPIVEMVPIKKEPTPEEIPLPLSPTSEPPRPHIIASSPQCTEDFSGAGARQPSTKDTINEYNSKVINAAPLHNLNTDSCVLSSAQNATVSTNSTPAQITEPITPINTHVDALSSPPNILMSEIPHYSAQNTSSD